jgi:hypothetical protein
VRIESADARRAAGLVRAVRNEGDTCSRFQFLHDVRYVWWAHWQHFVTPGFIVAPITAGIIAPNVEVRDT